METQVQVRAFNTCPNTPLSPLRMRRKILNISFGYRDMVRHELRATKYVSSDLLMTLILVSKLSSQPYRFVAKYLFYLQQFAVMVPKVSVLPSFLSVSSSMCFENEVREMLVLKDKLMKDGFAKFKDGTLVSQGEGLEDGIYLKKKEYLVRRINFFSKVYYDDLVRLYGIPYHFRDMCVQYMMSFCLLGGMNDAFKRIYRRIERHKLYSDDFVSVEFHRRIYSAQINGEEKYIIGDYRNYLEKFRGHCAFHMITFILDYEGCGEIALGEVGFNKSDTVFQYMYNVTEKNIIGRRFDRSYFGHIDLPFSEKGHVEFSVPFTDLHMIMKKFSLTFKGKLNLEMTVMTRLWYSDVCIAGPSCSLKHAYSKNFCNRKRQCVKAPLSSCNACRTSYLFTVYRRTSLFTNDALFQYMTKERDLRERYESLDKDMFYTSYEDSLVREEPLRSRVQEWMKCYDAYFCDSIGYSFPKPVSCQVVYRIDGDDVIELDRRVYNHDTKEFGQSLIWQRAKQKVELGTLDDFVICFSFSSHDGTLLSLFNKIIPEMVALFRSFTFSERQVLYDIDSGKLSDEAKSIEPLTFDDMLKNF